ncbi:MAG TPA: nucleotidyltransferase family protein [Baekduia sp.]|nr:nucleotidyltransferase family protein [Baekduia sp.]
MSQATASTRSQIWTQVDALVDHAPDVAGLRAHGLHLLAARRWRALGRPVPGDLRQAERVAALMAMTTPGVLRQIRETCSGPLVLMKGLEVGVRYPDTALRAFRDVDLLAADPEAAHAALVAAGFRPVGLDMSYDDRHHLSPLLAPGTPVIVEIHRRVEWPGWGRPPATEQLLAAAVPSATGVPGLGALAPEHHVLVVAAHSWSGAPLRRALDLVDLELLAAEAHPGALAALARAWDVDRLWRFLDSCAGALLRGDAAALPWWAPDVRALRDRTVLENHVSRVVAPFSVLPPRRAAGAALSEAGAAVLPREGEGWPAKLRRVRSSARHPGAAVRGRPGARPPGAARG